MVIDELGPASIEDAFQHALEFCRRYPGWIRYSEFEGDVTCTWKEQPASIRQSWRNHYRAFAKEAWSEWACDKGSRFPTAFVSGHGLVYGHICDVPVGHNLVMVVQHHAIPGRYLDVRGLMVDMRNLAPIA